MEELQNRLSEARRSVAQVRQQLAALVGRLAALRAEIAYAVGPEAGVQSAPFGGSDRADAAESGRPALDLGFDPLDLPSGSGSDR